MEMMPMILISKKYDKPDWSVGVYGLVIRLLSDLPLNGFAGTMSRKDGDDLH